MSLSGAVGEGLRLVVPELPQPAARTRLASELAVTEPQQS